MIIEAKIEEMGLHLPEPRKPRAAYVPVRQVGKLLYVSGQSCKKDGKYVVEGKLGQELTIEQGQIAARQAMLNTLGAVKGYLGDLDKIKQFIKINGYVRSVDGFLEQPTVIDGASLLLEQLFGEAGKHARTALSANELPFGTPVEIEAILEIK